jgi:chromosome segregation ATPase
VAGLLGRSPAGPAPGVGSLGRGGGLCRRQGADRTLGLGRALQRASEDLARAHTLAAEWETEVASVRAQLRQDHATLEEAHAWQRQAKEKAKEAEELRTSVAEKAASLTSAEEQLQQERAAPRQAEDQLQRERAALVEARAALEGERLAREEVLGRL